MSDVKISEPQKPVLPRNQKVVREPKKENEEKTVAMWEKFLNLLEQEGLLMKGAGRTDEIRDAMMNWFDLKSIDRNTAVANALDGQSLKMCLGRGPLGGAWRWLANFVNFYRTGFTPAQLKEAAKLLGEKKK